MSPFVSYYSFGVSCGISGLKELGRFLGRLTEFAVLEDNWDEYGAGPLPKAVAQAKSILR